MVQYREQSDRLKSFHVGVGVDCAAGELKPPQKVFNDTVCLVNEWGKR